MSLKNQSDNSSLYLCPPNGRTFLSTLANGNRLIKLRDQPFIENEMRMAQTHTSMSEAPVIEKTYSYFSNFGSRFAHRISAPISPTTNEVFLCALVHLYGRISRGSQEEDRGNRHVYARRWQRAATTRRPTRRCSHAHIYAMRCRGLLIRRSAKGATYTKHCKLMFWDVRSGRPRS